VAIGGVFWVAIRAISEIEKFLVQPEKFGKTRIGSELGLEQN